MKTKIPGPAISSLKIPDSSISRGKIGGESVSEEGFNMEAYDRARRISILEKLRRGRIGALEREALQWAIEQLKRGHS